jgi:hypothetical protein
MISGESVMMRSHPCALWQVTAGCLRSPPLSIMMRCAGIHR